MPCLGFDGIDGDEQRVKIAMIKFAFNNGNLIKVLRKRGNMIKNEKWSKLDKINDMIGNEIKSDQQVLDQLQRPCSAFVTFETEEGYNRALHYNEVIEFEEYKKFKTFLGGELNI